MMPMRILGKHKLYFGLIVIALIAALSLIWVWSITTYFKPSPRARSSESSRIIMDNELSELVKMAAEQSIEPQDVTRFVGISPTTNSFTDQYVWLGEPTSFLAPIDPLGEPDFRILRSCKGFVYWIRPTNHNEVIGIVWPTEESPRVFVGRFYSRFHLPQD
jgi:hypothetical protein